MTLQSDNRPAKTVRLIRRQTPNQSPELIATRSSPGGLFSTLSSARLAMTDMDLVGERLSDVRL
jgi:hypothetical protein